LFFLFVFALKKLRKTNKIIHESFEDYFLRSPILVAIPESTVKITRKKIIKILRKVIDLKKTSLIIIAIAPK